MGHVDVILKLMELPTDIQDKFLTKSAPNNKEIEIIISQRDGAKFLSEILPEDIGAHQHHLLPNINICTNKFIITGDIGINKELIDNDYPLFYIHKDNWKRMIDARTTGNEELLSRLIGEKWGIDEIRRDMNLPTLNDQCDNDIRSSAQLRDKRTIECYMANKDNGERENCDAVIMGPPIKQHDKLDYGDTISGITVERAIKHIGGNDAMYKTHNNTTKTKTLKIPLTTSVANLKTKIGHFLSKAFSWGQNRSKTKGKAENKNGKCKKNNEEISIAQHNNDEGIRHPCKYRRGVSNKLNLTQDHMSGSKVKDEQTILQTKLIIDGAGSPRTCRDKTRYKEINKYQKTKIIAKIANRDIEKEKENMNMKQKKTKVWKRNDWKNRRQGLQEVNKVSGFLYRIIKKPKNYEALKGTQKHE